MDQVAALRADVQAMREETEALRVLSQTSWDQLIEEFRVRFRVRTTLSIALAVAVLVGVGALSWAAVDSSRRIHESERRWCPMVSLLIPGPGEAVPTTERGRQVVGQARLLYAAFDCPGGAS